MDQRRQQRHTQNSTALLPPVERIYHLGLPSSSHVFTYTKTHTHNPPTIKAHIHIYLFLS